ncbi:hypothetical protein RUM43_013404 [Polyplax serrata]|uniref:Uncharacterized protein n=1 Tax=Polyplax serrata TaxID=468196 RepID=A0AAN8P1Y8_POLSC
MSAQMPELGSKISLISKADIRYEGRLFTVDPQECTIALANVRSFGTEDRETQYPVPAQSQVYDYILFRGSDIKDIRVVTTQIPNDPAIVQLVPPTINQQPGYQTQAFNHPVMGSSLSQYPGYGGMSGMPSGNMGLQRAPGPILMQPSELGASGSAPDPPQSEGPPPSLQTSNVPIGPLSIDKEQDLIGGVSRSTTPSVTRKSPTNDQGTQVNNSPARDDHKKPRPIQPPQRERDGSRRDHQMYQSGQSYQRDKDYQGNRKDYQPRDRGDYQVRDQYNYQRRGNRGRDNREGQRDDRDQRDHQARAGGGIGAPRNQRGNLRQSGGRSRGPPKHFNRPGGPTTKKTLKFDGDYDFDKANTEFEELRNQLVKVKIGNGSDAGGKVNGESDKKDDSGNETGAGENEQEEESIPEPCYDKSKSFFDTISCEAVERSKGRSQRTDWRTERKLNSETFGVASARHGAFRGRGYYGGRGYNRPQGGFRPRGPPRPERNSNQIDGKPQTAKEETNSL